jgi:hypothetical protein
VTLTAKNAVPLLLFHLLSPPPPTPPHPQLKIRDERARTEQARADATAARLRWDEERAALQRRLQEEELRGNQLAAEVGVLQGRVEGPRTPQMVQVREIWV